ncbi:SDR family NAD(P)-dependent oxidoreductase [Cellulomonas dongxiuzhuiae]|uniref:SDR family NAD(P)-dependent oxidoreductase n=1 Tax=Cellulomonas dongxiuzhuiae TaxID=2819979 RepID=A0ABX8GK58_9CELL|nr:SDR family NAD(P)-dependent oxidoreductase [Cellulomonas dongxiuzhuiae]MBO3095036.1 SDR family NAD(P)-dependent oxidoreductase [Cellulomonas dongxiuzhuiae]QWC16051.1 SDR family NAD(P)-dependent oxidoreductase [Cellulomonas dongxiuzhuiae]
MNARRSHVARPVVDLAGRVAVVTGAGGGMGRVLVEDLTRAGAHVVAVARDAPRTERLLRETVGDHGRFEVVEADLSLRHGVVDAATAIGRRHPHVHVLVNNAGAHFPDRGLTPDGVERHVAVDYLAAFGLTHLLRENLVAARGRVVHVASDSLNDTRQVKLLGRARPADLDPAQLDDLTRVNPADGFVAFEAYARAKLLTVTSGYHLARLLRPHGVTVNSVHPGIVATGIVDDLVPAALRPLGWLIRSGMRTPRDGASAALRLATDPALAGVTGRYYRREVVATTPAVSHDPAVQQRLHEVSVRWFAG